MYLRESCSGNKRSQPNFKPGHDMECLPELWPGRLVPETIFWVDPKQVDMHFTKNCINYSIDLGNSIDNQKGLTRCLTFLLK